MALILNIDCATDYASVCISNNKEVLGFEDNSQQKEHASFLQVAIKKLVETTGIELQQLDAVSVTLGPGSYTGLRVGMASAKGFCYALNKPLITINTLEVLTSAAITAQKTNFPADALFCPMIDARRMEVFTAVYDRNLRNQLPVKALEIPSDILQPFYQNNNLYFFGSGSNKCKSFFTNENAHFIEVQHSAKNLSFLADQYFINKIFSDLAYVEPFYGKEFYSLTKSSGS